MTAKELQERDAKRNLGDELLESVRQMKSGRAGKVHKVAVSPVVSARMKSGLSQSAFAKFLGVSVRTLQDWEQGRREPCVFHTKLDGDSTANWTAIPRQSGQEM